MSDNTLEIAGIIQGQSIASAELTVHEAVEAVSTIPPDAKRAVRDWITENLELLRQAAQDMLERLPENIMEYADQIQQILSSLGIM